jgi:cysteine desulfurase
MQPTRRSYLDHNATAPIRPEVADAVARALAMPGNPSSVHAEGRAARAAIERARDQVAALVGAKARNVVFTSGGTEGANTVLSPWLCRAGAAPASVLLAGATEHVCVLDGHRFPGEAAERIPVDGDGLVDLAWLEARLARQDGPALVSVQAANNETGVLQPVADVAALVDAAGGLVHTDAVQAAGRVSIDLRTLGADVLTLSAHKLGGPKGVGAIVLASEQIAIGEAAMRGGGQERGRRAGTENVAGIVGFGVAAQLAAAEMETERARLAGLTDALVRHLRRIAPEAVIFGDGVARLPNTTAFAVPGVKAETALIALDLDGIAVSSGSACSSGKVRRSHVLKAMGVVPSLAEGAIRVSFGWNSTEADVEGFVTAFEKLVGNLYKRRANAA